MFRFIVIFHQYASIEVVSRAAYIQPGVNKIRFIHCHRFSVCCCFMLLFYVVVVVEDVVVIVVFLLLSFCFATVNI